MTIDSNWNSKHKIVIDNTKVSGSSDLTDFPVLLTEDNFFSDVFSNTQSNGEDLRFSTDSAGDNEIPREVVKWDTSTPAAEVWVKVPTLYCDQDTTIYVHYDNPDASGYAETDTYGAQNVWNTNYKMVQHLTNNANDSTSNNNDGTVYGATSGVSGQIAEAYSFDGTDDYVDMGFVFLGTLALHAWFYTDETSTRRNLFGNRKSNPYYIRLFGVENGEYELITYDYDTGAHGIEKDLGNSVAYPTGQWVHVVAIFEKTASNSANYYIYENGTLVASTSDDYYETDAYNFYFGAYNKEGSPGNLWHGSIDELRIMDYVPSADWIATEYNNQSSPSSFAKLGGVLVTTDTYSNLSSDSVQLNGTLESLGDYSSLDVYFEYGTDTSYENTTSIQTISSDSTSFSDTIPNLVSCIEYHYRSVATDGSTYWYGSDSSFVTCDLQDVDKTQAEFQEGTLDGVITTSPDVLKLGTDYALLFDGIDDYVEIPFQGQSNPYTLEMWVYPNNVNRGTLFSNYNVSTGAFALEWENSGIRLWDDSGGSNIHTGSFSDNQWLHVASVTDASGNAEIYVNGNLEAGPVSGHSGLLDQGQNYHIGNRPDDNDYPFDGKIKDVRIWSEARTQTEIQNNKNKELTGDETNLVAYYPTKEGSGTTLYDYAGSKDGMIDGATWTTGFYRSSGNRLSPQLDLSSLSAYSDSLIEWTATLNGQSLTIETRHSLDGGSSWSSWQTCTSGSALPGLSSGDDLSNALLECKQTLSTSDTTTTPELSYLGIYIVESTTTTISASVTDGVSLSDSSGNTATFLTLVQDGISLGDNNINLAQLVTAALDGVSLSDSADIPITILAQVADSVVLSDVSSGEMTVEVECFSGVQFSDAASAILQMLVEVSDGIVLTDASLEASRLPDGRVRITITGKSSKVAFDLNGPDISIDAKYPSIKFGRS